MPIRQVQYTYDQEGHQLTRTGSAEAVAQTYDAAYRVISLADGNDHATDYQYDTAGRLTQITYPDGHLVQFTQFDAAGRVLERVDGNGVHTDYEYNDPGGSLTKIDYPATPGYDDTFTYDTDGRRTNMTDPTGSTDYTAAQRVYVNFAYDGAGYPATGLKPITPPAR